MTHNRKPSCSVIVINYNGRDLLDRFLPSIERLDYENYEVIIVDNASTDDSVPFVKSNYPQFKIVENPQNFGTAEGSNRGIPHAKGDYILWLSNDMEVNPLLLRRMIDTAESPPDIGICTCKMRRLTPHGKKTNVIDSVGGDIDIHGFPSARGIHEKDLGQLDKVSEVFFSFGGAMLIKKKVLERIGAYDPTFFTLVDDIDLCWRAHLAGFKVVVQPEALLYHRVSATLGTAFGRSRKRFWSEKNTFRTLLKNYSTLTLVKVIPKYVSLLIAETIFFFSLRKFSMVRAYVKAILWNILNFKDTWINHVKIQQLRKVSDKEIQKMMVRKPIKIRIFKEFIWGISGVGSWQAYFGEPTVHRYT